MDDDNDIRLAAEKFLARFGKNAPREAAMRVEELLETGDREGHDLWLRIYQQVLDKTSHGE